MIAIASNKSLTAIFGTLFNFLTLFVFIYLRNYNVYKSDPGNQYHRTASRILNNICPIRLPQFHPDCRKTLPTPGSQASIVLSNLSAWLNYYRIVLPVQLRHRLRRVVFRSTLHKASDSRITPDKWDI